MTSCQSLFSHLLLSASVHIIHVYVWVCINVHMYRDQRGALVEPPLSLSLPMRYSLPLNLELGWQPAVLSPPPTVFQVCVSTPSFSHGFRDLNSDPHAFVAGAITHRATS